MSNIKQSLTRKIGPLPVWAWTGLFFIGVWYYRNKLSKSESGTGTGSVGPTPATPQPQSILQPGESLYDPNTGTLTTAPGGSGTTGDGSGSGSTTDSSGLADAINALTDAIAAGEHASQGGGGVTNNYYTTTPPNRGKRPKLTAKGAIYGPFGKHRPPPKSGYTVKGLGRGYWEYVPNKRTPKGKKQHGAPKNTTGHKKTGSKTKARSAADIRTGLAGRVTGRTGRATPNGRMRGGAKAVASARRMISGRRTTPVISRPTVRQRPVANATPTRPATRSAPRPSAPAARTVRAPSRPPAPARRTARRRP